MPRKVATVGGTPTWRRGMAAVLTEAGYTTVGYESLSGWRPGRGGVAIVMWAAEPEERQMITDFVAEYPHIPVMAVVPRMDVGTFAETIRAGAAGAIDEADEEAVFARTIDAAISGRVDAARQLVAAMARRIPSSPEPSAWVAADEADWLRALADGATVAALAEQIGYSERETFRMLGELYAKLGVKNRTEAIIWATRHGVLDPDGA
jgi:DNA-binding NarL/FixJ family response regulator